jgi:Uma2 family endonuclease
MASTTHIPVSQYLATVYRPDREYVDGEVRERNVGKFEHARVQALLAAWFGQREQLWQVLVVTEQRVQVSARRVRIPDVALIAPGPHPDVLIDPPLLVIEILSPDDTYWDTEERASDYLAMGVKAAWILDPKTRTGRMCVGQSWLASVRLEVPQTAIYLDVPRLFSRLDEPQAV